MSNRLAGESSPYLLQHAENPVDWYPFGREAFERARAEDKPVFLSIGYSTCHWCHVMAEDCFEDEEIAALLNRSFISVKVDREERPDLDSLYMAVCQAFTGHGGWPANLFLTAEQEPFFAGLYFPKVAFRELLGFVRDRWQDDRPRLLRSAREMTEALNRSMPPSPGQPERGMTEAAIREFASLYDPAYGGFGSAPKFPAAHNLLFLLQQAEKTGDRAASEMALTTLRQMYRGGLFDQIGGGFCRYSTDRFFLVPHFEKMLSDNALLILAYARAFALTGASFCRETAERTAAYVRRELTSPEGAFYAAQDADSEGEEGKYYRLSPGEMIALLGPADGERFNRCFGIGEAGNTIPNRLGNDGEAVPAAVARLLPSVQAYRRRRCPLHTDGKILTAWNSLMIAALCALYRITREASHLRAAEAAYRFLTERLRQGETLFVSYRDGHRGVPGFLTEYACFALASLALYDATLEERFLREAAATAARATDSFFDYDRGGFFTTARESEPLIARQKETYDGALPSGNSVMTFVLVRLQALLPDDSRDTVLRRQLAFQCGEAAPAPSGYAFFQLALSDWLDPPEMVTVVAADRQFAAELPFLTSPDSLVRILDGPQDGCRLLNGQTTYYVCREHVCLPPTNRFPARVGELASV